MLHLTFLPSYLNQVCKLLEMLLKYDEGGVTDSNSTSQSE